jgi:NAD(P)-dependent dehydrogenase (short-subunit alcohol dehydrogenase family)
MHNGASALTERRVLVTGGAGFIGSHLCERLLERGDEVLCVDNFYTGTRRNVQHLLSNPLFEVMRHDVCFPLYVEVDEIFNLACPASPVHYQFDPVQTTKVSVHGSINILGLAKRVKAKVLQASTSEVYGDPTVHPQKEDYWGNVNPIGLRSCYDKANGARKPYSSIINASIVCRSRLHGSSILMVRACIQTMGASYRTSLSKPSAMSTLRFMARATRPARFAISTILSTGSCD